MNKKRNILIAGIALVLVVCVAVFLLLPRGYKDVRIMEMGGVVTYDRGTDINVPVYDNMKLTSGDAMTTGKDESFARMALDSSKVVFMEQDSKVNFDFAGGINSSRMTLNLEYGAVVNEIEKPLGNNDTYEVKTPNALMAVRGTRFRVSLYYDKKGTLYTRISGLEGKVECSKVMPDGTVDRNSSVMAESGKEAIIYFDRENNDTDFVTFNEAGEPLPLGDSGSKIRDMNISELPVQTLYYFTKRVSEGAGYDSFSNSDLTQVITISSENYAGEPVGAGETFVSGGDVVNGEVSVEGGNVRDSLDGAVAVDVPKDGSDIGLDEGDTTGMDPDGTDGEGGSGIGENGAQGDRTETNSSQARTPAAEETNISGGADQAGQNPTTVTTPQNATNSTNTPAQTPNNNPSFPETPGPSVNSGSTGNSTNTGNNSAGNSSGSGAEGGSGSNSGGQDSGGSDSGQDQGGESQNPDNNPGGDEGNSDSTELTFTDQSAITEALGKYSEVNVKPDSTSQNNFVDLTNFTIPANATLNVVDDNGNPAPVRLAEGSLVNNGILNASQIIMYYTGNAAESGRTLENAEGGVIKNAAVELTNGIDRIVGSGGTFENVSFNVVSNNVRTNESVSLTGDFSSGVELNLDGYAYASLGGNTVIETINVKNARSDAKLEQINAVKGSKVTNLNISDTGRNYFRLAGTLIADNITIGGNKYVYSEENNKIGKNVEVTKDSDDGPFILTALSV